MENENEVTTEETLAEGAGVTPSSGDKSADEGSNPESSSALTLDELNQYLGKDFKSKEAALKSFKDTFNYVGKRKEDIVKEAVDEKPNLEEKVKFLEQDNWFARNNQYESYRSTITALQKEGQSLDDVVASDAFKTIYEKARIGDEVESSKSVLHSNPKLGTVKNKMSEAEELLKGGKPQEAGRAATQAVIDAYGLDK